ncbi:MULTISPECIES: DUF3048 domain-containing protein [Cytobacillus]|uniref:DUF3048 domain-containing protein n=1 Tax=Cytobacillus firmus TaxID=1399 RepID=A0AA46Q1I2_CYTFI|nr:MULTISPECIES: DUF3048 domain-containing protein [Cytobacillus]KML40126.1 lipoprotein YerB [Cytobacillus firmus]MCC3649595.1 DUF3048 domain-containing protein [Cytobacillus oceanisediminis]UYG97765.1 DUF3048 domain-containing protein [Cytobacillus firmus]
MLKRWIAVSAAAMLLVSGCSKEKAEEPAKQETEKAEEATKGVSSEKELPFQYPLTGSGSETEVNGRAVAVMINNHPKARPQSGLNQADVVYEMLAEGDVTRFLAIFQSERPEMIGPVRSSRDYYIELAKGYDSLYIAHGYSPEAKELLDQGYVDNLNGMQYDGTLFKRESFRQAPHNSYISFDNVLKGAKEKNYAMEDEPKSLEFLSKEEVKAIQGEKADSAMISYMDNELFNVIFEYDAGLEKYKRYTNGELTADYKSGEPVLLDNIFIAEADHQVVDSAGRRDINLTTGGKGYLLQKGKVTELQWENIDGRILPVLNGQQAGLVPGKTWINIVPSNPGLEQTVSLEAKQ